MRLDSIEGRTTMEKNEQEKNASKSAAEDLAQAIVSLPQKLQDKIAGAVMMAQLVSAEKAG